MDFFKWWWWHVLDEDRRGDIFASLSVAGIVIAIVFLGMAHRWFYPWMLCLDLFLVITVPGGWLYWYFTRQHKTYQKREEDDQKD